MSAGVHVARRRAVVRTRLGGGHHVAAGHEMRARHAAHIEWCGRGVSGCVWSGIYGNHIRDISNAPLGLGLLCRRIRRTGGTISEGTGTFAPAAHDEEA